MTTSNKLKAEIAKLIEKKGAIPFDEYMELCLYHPQFGYYATSSRVIGKEGDYYTSSDIHPLFGWTLGKYFLYLIERENFSTILEIGPGKGLLAYDILSFLEENARDFKNIRYILVEKSGAMREEIVNNLKNYRDNISIFDSLDSVPQFEGIVFSNELFDALPHKRFKWRGNRWTEIFVIYEDDSFKEVEMEVESDFKKHVLDRYEPFVEDGTVVEWSPEAFTIIKGISEKQKRGIFIAIDYGEERQELISIFREGSLIGYRKHTVINDPYKYPGEQDLTCHVDFTLLREILEEYGYRVHSFKDQGKFLIDAGILDVLDTIDKTTPTLDAIKARLSFKKLVLDFGRNYRVLSAIKT